MRILNCNAFATVTVALMSLLSSGIVYADSLEFGVVGSPIDLSANVHEAILPGGMVFQDSKPLFGTAPDPKQSAELCTSRQRASTPRAGRPTFPPHSHPHSRSRTAMAAWV